MALIGDLRGSRKLEDRAAVQERLLRELAGIQERYAEAIACDEALTGLHLRYGLGWGTLATRLQPEAVGMDGPCFHAARRAIEWSKQHDAWLAVRGLDPTAESTLDGLLRLLGAVRVGWTAKQARAVALRRLAPNQRELALQLELDPSTVSKRLKSALYEEVTAAERSVAALLSHFTGTTADAPLAPESP